MPIKVESERLKQKKTKKVKLSLPYWLLGSKKFILGIFYWSDRGLYSKIWTMDGKYEDPYFTVWTEKTRLIRYLLSLSNKYTQFRGPYCRIRLAQFTALFSVEIK